MIFTTYTFVFFLSCAFLVYWNVRAGLRNAVVIGLSFVFYGWLDWRLCGLLAVSAGCAYLTGRWACSCPSKRKMALAASLVVNLGMLAFFKYYNFFVMDRCLAFLFGGRTEGATDGGEASA